MRGLSILLVDDDDLEVKATRRAFAKAQVDAPLFVARDGLEALALLRDQYAPPSTPSPRRQKDQPPPSLVLLDLNMPRMNGIAFLSALRKDPQLHSLPVVVMTTSSEEQGRKEAYRLGVAGYIIKPIEFPTFVDICKVVHAYWSFCCLP